MYDPEDYPALTYQHVVDVADELAGLSAVPELTLKLEELHALLPRLQRIADVADANRQLANELGYPVRPLSPYVGVGVHVVISGPGQAQVLVVGTRKMEAKDVADQIGSLFDDEDVEPLREEATEEDWADFWESEDAQQVQAGAEVVTIYEVEDTFTDGEGGEWVITLGDDDDDDPDDFVGAPV